MSARHGAVIAAIKTGGMTRFKEKGRNVTIATLKKAMASTRFKTAASMISSRILRLA